MTEVSALGFLVPAAESALTDDKRATLRRFSSTEAIDPGILATLAHSPGRLERFLDFYGQLVTDSFSDPRLKDVVRRRVSELDRLIRAHDLPADASELRPPSGLAADELALVRFIDAFAVDYRNISDEVFGDLRAHFTVGELTELLWAVAIIRGMARVGSVVGVPLER